MIHIRSRNPRPKLTKYIIKVSPQETREIALQGRTKPRKLRLAQVRQFNKMIEDGIIAQPRFNTEGRIMGFDKLPNNLTPDQVKAMERIIKFTASKEFRDSPSYESHKSNKKWSNFLSQHERRGGFEYLSPALEWTILSGESAETVILFAELQNGMRLPELREQISRFNTKEKIEKNLRTQSRYFEQLLKKTKKTEMVINEDVSDLDRSVTKIKLTPRGVERETTVRISDPNSGSVRLVTILRPDGKLVHQEVAVYR